MTDRDTYHPIDPPDAPATVSGAPPATTSGRPPTPTDASAPAAPATPPAAHATPFAPDASDAPTVAWETPRPTAGDDRVAPAQAERVRLPTGGSRVRWAAATL